MNKWQEWVISQQKIRDTMRHLPILLLFLLASCTQKHLPTPTPLPAPNHSKPIILPAGVVTANKMNVFYVGVDNSLSASIAGVSSKDVVVSVDSGTVKKDFASMYNVRVSKTGQVKVTLSTSTPELKFKETFYFRAKRVPDPVPVLGTKNKHEFTPDEFHQFLGLWLSVKDFDFDVRCENLGFTLTRVASDGARQSVANEGMRFSEAAQTLIHQAQNGDIFIFSDIRAHCPEDEQDRQLNNVAYFIKTP